MSAIRKPHLVWRRLRAEARRCSWELRYLVGPSPTPAPPDWRDQASCRVHGFEWFTIDTREAVHVCDGCPVRLLCIHDARAAEDDLAVHHITNVAGGLTAPNRMALQKQLRKGIRDAPVEVW